MYDETVYEPVRLETGGEGGGGRGVGVGGTQACDGTSKGCEEESGYWGTGGGTYVVKSTSEYVIGKEEEELKVELILAMIMSNDDGNILRELKSRDVV